MCVCICLGAVGCTQHRQHLLCVSRRQLARLLCVRDVGSKPRSSPMSRIPRRVCGTSSSTCSVTKFGGKIPFLWLKKNSLFVCMIPLYNNSRYPPLLLDDQVTVRPMLWDRCPAVCNVGVLWPNGWMDQDTTWYRGRPRPRRHCVRWRPRCTPMERGTVATPLFGPCLLWPNCWALVIYQ